MYISKYFDVTEYTSKYFSLLFYVVLNNTRLGISKIQ